jgi:hypothetical protein
MATIDKIRVREEVDHLKREFEQLCADGKVAPDTRVVVNSLLAVVELPGEENTQEQQRLRLAPPPPQKKNLKRTKPRPIRTARGKEEARRRGPCYPYGRNGESAQ